MQKPPIPFNEAQRLQALQALEILDTSSEERFDRLTRIAQHILQVPITLISLVDVERQWFKSRQGLDARETPREISFCGHAILGTETLLVPDTKADVRFADNPLVVNAPHIRFYAGAPLTLSSGLTVGTLCAIDSEPREVSQAQLAVLHDLAQCVVVELERTKQQREIAELVQMQSRYVAIIESSTTAIISKTLDGEISSWNRAAETLFGYTAEESIGRTITMLVPQERLAEEAMILSRVMHGERVDLLETVRLRKDGSAVEVSVGVSPIRDREGAVVGAAKIVHDISQRKAAEAALQRSAQLVQSIVETVVDGIITIDGQGTILSFNTAAERIFGYEKTEVIGSNVNCLMPEPHRTKHDGCLSNYLTTRKAQVVGIGREVTGQRKNGQEFPLELAISEMRQSHQTLFVGIVRDITERKRMERMKAEFVSTVSHELRTPLTSIRGALGLVLGKFAASLSDRARQLLGTANRNAERLTLLINDILDLEKMESGQLDFRFAPIDIVAITRQAITSNEGYGQQHQVGIRLSETIEGAFVSGDEHRLLQVFANLLSNAIKYSRASDTVEVAVQRNGKHLRVSVRDFGHGIPAEFRSRIFQRFSQADSSDTREKGGTGLGLSIAKAIVERHGGSLAFTSEEGVGTEFYFELPEWREVAQNVLPEGDREGKGNLPSILHVEDDQDLIQVLHALLEEDADYSYATTLAAARQLLSERRFDLLLLDLSLPDGQGSELLDEIGSDTTVILFSDQEPGENLQKVAASLVKGATSNTLLLATIKQFLRQASQ